VTPSLLKPYSIPITCIVMSGFNFFSIGEEVLQSALGSALIISSDCGQSGTIVTFACGGAVVNTGLATHAGKRHAEIEGKR